MFDAKRLLDQFLGSQSGPDGKGGGAGEFMKGAGGGALAGGLAALLLGSHKGRKIGGKALKMGGMAAVGALAYKAYRDWEADKQAPAGALERAAAAGAQRHPVQSVGGERPAAAGARAVAGHDRRGQGRRHDRQ
jgi:uncharacterized membrane protein YebE (DUF533 family)